MKRSAVPTIIVAALLGAAIWALSPWLGGHREPWDARGAYYPAALVVAGLASGFVSPRPLWAHYAGNVLGQLAYELVAIGAGPLVVIGVAFLFVYGLLFAASAFAGGWIRMAIGRIRTTT
jgi:hypothetical protein